MQFLRAIQQRFRGHPCVFSAAGHVRKMEKVIRTESAEALQARLLSLKDRAASLRTASGRREIPQDFLNEATALAGEAVYRTLGFRLHSVQISAALAAARGAISELQTGEGKTVVTGVIAFLKSLQFPTVHVATTNAYLASRDRENLTPFFDLLGMTHSVLPEGNEKTATRLAYQCQVTYGPGYQFGFDFLKDQITLRSGKASRLGSKTLHSLRQINLDNQLLQPSELHCMVVDEADSVMIDEAVIPMVLSGPSSHPDHPEIFHLARDLVAGLEADKDFRISRVNGKIELSESVQRRLHRQLAQWRSQLHRPWETYLINALKAQHLLIQGEHFVVQKGEVQIVDQMTGRVFPDRNWKDSLHQAVEANVGVAITSGRDSIARITRQRFLQQYQDLCGLTGTAKQVENEFNIVYGCSVKEIPPNLTCQRHQLPARFFNGKAAKLGAICDEVMFRHEIGQPLLIGTCTILESQTIHKLLADYGLRATLLNGVQDEAEANIVANAGQPGAITIATNMAGRGTDIHLPPASIRLGGLHVIASEFNFSTRVDRQLAGRAARQGQPGSVQFFASAEDQLLVKHGGQIARKMVRTATPSGECQFDFSDSIRRIQSSLERQQFESRQTMMNHELWMDSIRTAFEQSRKAI